MSNVLINWQKEFLVKTEFDYFPNETSVVKLSELDDFLRNNPEPPKPELQENWDKLKRYNEIYKMNKSWFQEFYEKIRLGFTVIDIYAVENDVLHFCQTKRELTDSIGVPVMSKYEVDHREYFNPYCNTYGYPKNEQNQDVSINVTDMLINGTHNDGQQPLIAFESQKIEFVIIFGENEE